MGLTVIDIGAADHGGDQSVRPLIEEFQPDRLIGYDPLLEASYTATWSGCQITMVKRAAWIHDGTIEFVKAGLGSHVEAGSKHWFRCDDIVRVVREQLDAGGDVIVKMDAEFGEYTMLPALIEADLDLRIKVLLVEFHCPRCKHGEWSHSEACERGDEPNVMRESIEAAWRGEMRGWTR